MKKNLFKHPLSQIVVFILAMTLLQLLSGWGVLPNSFVYALGNTMIYAIIAVGFCLLLGYSGLASLGTAGFIGIGAYTAFYVLQQYGLPYIVAFLITLAIRRLRMISERPRVKMAR